MLLDQLRQGDRRSIGRANAVAEEVLSAPKRFPELIAGLWHADPLVRMRAGDAVFRVSALQGLAELAAGDPALRPWVRRQLHRALKKGSPAERARARKLIAWSGR